MRRRRHGESLNRPTAVAPLSIRLLGIRIDCFDLSSLLEAVGRAARQRIPISVMYVNVHCMNLLQGDAEYREVLAASDIVYCDGTGVRLGARLACQPVPSRMTGADWIENLCHYAIAHDLSLFLLGGPPGVADSAADRLRFSHPGIDIRGAASGYEVGNETVEMINRCKPDIALVGMGSPTQEKWIAQHREELDVPVVWAVGALFEFVTGRIPRGPAWMTEHGFEWMCRLAVEPRKLWRRYLIGNPRFIARVLLVHRLHR